MFLTGNNNPLKPYITFIYFQIPSKYILDLDTNGLYRLLDEGIKLILVTFDHIITFIVEVYTPLASTLSHIVFSEDKCRSCASCFLQGNVQEGERLSHEALQISVAAFHLESCQLLQKHFCN